MEYQITESSKKLTSEFLKKFPRVLEITKEDVLERWFDGFKDNWNNGTINFQLNSKAPFTICGSPECKATENLITFIFDKYYLYQY